MRRRLGKRGCTLLVIIVFIVGVWLFNYLFLGYRLTTFDQQRLPNAISTWESKWIKNYRIMFDITIPLVTFGVRYNLIVENNQIIQASWKRMVDLINPTTCDPDKVSFEPLDPNAQLGMGSIADYTIENRFALAELWLQDYRPIEIRSTGYDIDYDPQYGYIKSILECCLHSISDCWYSYKVIEFEPLPG